MKNYMKQLTPAKIAELCSGSCYGPEKLRVKEVSSIVTDNRQIEKDGLFVAIKGAKVDANRFIPAAYESGAICCLSEEKPDFEQHPDWKNRCYIVVDSCLQAVKDIATFYRQVYPVKVLGITGSVGKTSTKEMLASVLSQKFCTLKTQGNFNNELGVPLTLFRLRECHEVAIIEMGISEFGEMTRLSHIVKPDACIITNIGQCHLENLGNRDGVLKAKTEIFTDMNPEGTAYLYGDDDKLATVKEVYGKDPVFFGFQEQNGVYAEKIVSKGLAGTEFEAVTKSGRFMVHVPVPGQHMVSNALAAIAVGLDFGMKPEEIVKGIAAFEPVGGHGSVVVTDKFSILDDCYNANPVSMKAGIDVLSEVSGRKVAILGDMFELGTEEKELHFEVGVHASGRNPDELICIGKLAKEIAEGARQNQVDSKMQIRYYETKEEAIPQIPQFLKAGDSVLVKASHGMHFEKIVAVLKEMC